MTDACERMKVDAIAFAVRAGHTNEMAHKFLVRIGDRGQLGQPIYWPRLLAELMDERRADEISRRALEEKP